MIWNKATYFLSNLGIGLDNDSYTMLHTVWDSYIMIVIPSPIILSIITDIQVRSVNVSYNLSSGMSSTQCCSSCSSLICCSDSSWLNLLPHLPLGVPTLDISWHFVESWASGQITSPPHATRASPLGFSYWPQICIYIYICVCVYVTPQIFQAVTRSWFKSWAPKECSDSSTLNTLSHYLNSIK